MPVDSQLALHFSTHQILVMSSPKPLIPESLITDYITDY